LNSPPPPSLPPGLAPDQLRLLAMRQQQQAAFLAAYPPGGPKAGTLMRLPDGSLRYMDATTLALAGGASFMQQAQAPGGAGRLPCMLAHPGHLAAGAAGLSPHMAPQFFSAQQRGAMGAMGVNSMLQRNELLRQAALSKRSAIAGVGGLGAVAAEAEQDQLLAKCESISGDLRRALGALQGRQEGAGPGEGGEGFSGQDEAAATLVTREQVVDACGELGAALKPYQLVGAPPPRAPGLRLRAPLRAPLRAAPRSRAHAALTPPNPVNHQALKPSKTLQNPP